MSFGPLNFKCLPLVVCAAFACSRPEAFAQQQRAAEGQKKESFDSINSSSSLNTNAPVVDSTLRKDLDEAYKIRKPDSFDSTDPFDTPGTSFMRTPAPAIKSKRVMELLQKRKDWVFLEPTEEDFGLTVEDIFKIRDKKTDEDEKEEMTPLERFYHRRDQDMGKTNAPSETTQTDKDKDSDSFDMDNLWAGKSDSRPNSTEDTSAQSTRDNSDSTFRAPSVSTVNLELFGMGTGKAQSDDIADANAARAQEVRMNEFKKLLDTYYSSSGGSPSVGAGGKSDPGGFWNPPSPPPAVSSRRVTPFDATPKSPFSSLPVGGPAPFLPPDYQKMTPSGFPSLTPTLPVEERRRLTTPEPIYSKPKSHF